MNHHTLVSTVAVSSIGLVPCVCCAVLLEGAGAGQGHSCGAQPGSEGDCV